MTLIAIATYGKHAEFIVDTLSYKKNGSSFGRTTKSRVLHHLDTAIVTQGDGRFGDLVSVALSVTSDEVSDFDELMACAPTIARCVWEDQGGFGGYGSCVFLVGYSPTAGEFRAFGLSSDRNNFEAEELSAPHVMPAPFDCAPSGIELNRLVTALRSEGAGDEYLSGLENEWPKRPALAAPRNKSEWQSLAKKVREHRTLDRGRTRTPVGGDVHHTRIARGKASTHVIHTYNDFGDELVRMVAGTVHPIAQRGPCECGSGKSYRECCLVQHLDTLCNCSSGLMLRECCAISSRPDPDDA